MVSCSLVDNVKLYCTWCQAQWEYFDNMDFEPYPDEINVIIENAYQDKKPFAEWQEQNARYRLTFETMEEEMASDATSKVKVRRSTKGEGSSTRHNHFPVQFWAVNTKTNLSDK